MEFDASNMVIGAVLSQAGKPLAYFNKALAHQHQVLSVYKNEMLVLLAVVKKWHAYLVSRHFRIKTNHFSLKFLLDQTTNTSAQQSWVIKMMGYDYEVIFKKGVSNMDVDALSRLLVTELKAISVVSSDLMTRIQHSWVNDSRLVHLIHSLTKNSRKHSKYTWKNQQLKRKDKLVIG